MFTFYLLSGALSSIPQGPTAPRRNLGHKSYICKGKETQS